MTLMSKGKCVICGNKYHDKGHNPSPISDEGRCCAVCNAIHVIPIRISQFTLQGGSTPKA